MLATEIQKSISNNQTPKRLRKTPIFTINKSKKRTNPKSSKNHQRKNFFQKKLKRFRKSRLFTDDISLETNSTTNTLEEEYLLSNEDMCQYFNEIEFVLKDLCEKGVYPKDSLELFLTEKRAQNGTKTGNVKFLPKNYKNILESISPNEKIKLILDIDETLVYSQVIQEIQNIPNEKHFFSDKNHNTNLIQNIGQDEYYIKIYENTQEKIFLVKVQVRKGLALFFKKLSPFCDFYINTMASKAYVSEILKILEKDYDFFIKEENVIYTSPYGRKILDEKIIKEENFLILDDNICAWEICFTPSIIPVKKFNDMNLSQIKNIDIYYQYYLFSNKIYCFNETKGGFVDSNNKIPHCVEMDKVIDSEKNNKSQLYYITEIIIKSFLLKKILNIPIRHCLHYIQNTILKNCKIYYQGYEQDFIYELILLLGGNIISDISDMNNATHIIYNKNYLTYNEYITGKAINKENGAHIIDVKWIFDCFFKFKKCNEKELDYKI